MIQPELLVSMSAVDGVLPIIAAGDNPGKRECQQGEDTAEFEHLTSFQSLNSWLVGARIDSYYLLDCHHGVRVESGSSIGAAAQTSWREARSGCIKA